MGLEEDKRVYPEGVRDLGFYERALGLFELIKLPHTIFSVPFAVMSAFLAADGVPALKQLVLILGALVMARNCAMGFNRLADFQYDSANPRTKQWTVLQMELGRPTLWAFTVVSALCFVLFAAALNRLTLYLSPAALAVVMLYSYTKRLSNLSHFILGLALALAPLGAWVAIRASLDVVPCLLAAAVLLWTAGFDIIYSCQDVEHDTRMGLHSIPRTLGIKNALRLSLMLHVLMLGLLLLLTGYAGLGNIYLSGVCVTAALLFYEHSLVKPDDLSRVNVAFFTINGFISLALMAFTLIDILVT